MQTSAVGWVVSILSGLLSVAGGSVSAPNRLEVALPATEGPHPALLLFAGETDCSAAAASRWAEQGYVAVSVCWRAGDLQALGEVLHSLRYSLAVQGRPVAVVGEGRGAEPALALTMMLSRRAPELTPNAVAVHAPSDRLESSGWTWGGDSAGLLVGAPIHLERYSGSLSFSHGEMDARQSVEASRALERQLRASGAAVFTSQSSSESEFSAEPCGRCGAQAVFHYFKGEGTTFSDALESRRLEFLARFLRESLAR